MSADSLPLLRRYPRPLYVERADLLGAGRAIIENFTPATARRDLFYSDLLASTKDFWSLREVLFALDVFVESELDFIDPSDLGHGRVDLMRPRFGAYHRDRLSRMSREDKLQLRDQLIALMLSSYLGACIFLKPPNGPISLSKEQFFESWVLKLYSSTNPDPHENHRYLAGGSYLASLNAYIAERSLRRGFLGFFDRTPLLLSYFFFGGWGFRLVEIDPRSIGHSERSEQNGRDPR